MVKNITFSAMLSVITVLLFTSQMIIPLAGVFIAFFSLIPLILTYKLTNLKYFIIATLTSGFLILILNDIFGFIFFSTYLLPPVLSIVYNKKNKIPHIIFFLVPVASSYFMYKSFFNSKIFEYIWPLIGASTFIVVKFYYIKLSELILKRLKAKGF
ncbi:YybS family protein [Marinitoga arctica]